MKSTKLSIEQVLYFLSLLIALGLRCSQLGKLPLSDSEAQWALQAFDISRNSPVQIGPQPLYILWTGFLFYMFGSSDLIARILPALAGSLLVLSPYLIKERIGRSAALILSLFLALDSGMVAISRLAGGEAFALVFGILFFVFFLREQKIASGICLGLAMLGSPGFWLFVSGLGIVMVWDWIAGRKDKDNDNNNNDGEEKRPLRRTLSITRDGTRNFLISVIATLLLAGTFFFQHPSGISAFVSGFVGFMRGWLEYSGIPISQIIIALLVYESFILIPGIWQMVLGIVRQDKVDKFLSRWTVVMALLVVIYPSHRVIDLVFVIIPAAVLGARRISEFVSSISTEEWLPSLGQAVLMLILLVFAIYNMLAFVNPTAGTVDLKLRWVGFGGAILLLLLIVLLVAWGWSVRVAGYGLLWGFGLFLLIYFLSSSWSAAGLGRRPDTDLWRTSPNAQEMDLLMSTMGDTSEWNTGVREILELMIIGEPSPALRWAVRNMRQVSIINNLSSGLLPPMLITGDQQSISLSAQYSGQDFVINQAPNWSDFMFVDWAQWMIYRETPVQKQTVVFWVRSDLFPSAKLPVVK